jgi:hypothetical protein
MLVEFACDSVFGTDMAQGYDDTIRDLIADGAGGHRRGVGCALLAAQLRFVPRSRVLDPAAGGTARPRTTLEAVRERW